MEDEKSQGTDVAASVQRSPGEGVEKLFAGANDALARSADNSRPEWQKFYAGMAAAYKESAVHMKALADFQEGLQDTVATIRRRFQRPTSTAPTPAGQQHASEAPGQQALENREAVSAEERSSSDERQARDPSPAPR